MGAISMLRRASHRATFLLLRHRFFVLQGPIQFPPAHPSTTSPLVLRPYQQQCIDEVLRELQVTNRVAISLPVGSGKTVIFARIIAGVPEPEPFASKTLVLAHREELLDQAREKIKEANPTFVVEVEQGKRCASDDAHVVVASVPTVGRLNSVRLARFDPRRFKLIVIDECHHATADTYKRVLQYFGALTPTSHIRVLGCSATLRRHDGIALGQIFEKIAFDCSLIRLWQDQHLAPLRSFKVETNTSLKNVPTESRTKDFEIGKLAKAVDTPERNALVVNTWLQYAKDKRKSTLVFCTTVEHIENMTRMFWSMGIDARYVHGGTPKEERASLVRLFREQKFPVLINCGVFTEGTDIPCIDCLLMARPTQSTVLYQQMVGRGLRTFSGKTECWCFDFVDSFSNDLFTSPCLLGLQPLFDANGQELMSVHSKMQAMTTECDDVMDAISLEHAQKLIKAREAQPVVREEIFFDGSPSISVSNQRNSAKQSRESPIVLPLGWNEMPHHTYARHINIPGMDILLVVLPFHPNTPATQPTLTYGFNAKSTTTTNNNNNNDNVSKLFLYRGFASVRRGPSRELMPIPMTHDSVVSAVNAVNTFAAKKLKIPNNFKGWKRSGPDNSYSEPITEKQLLFLKSSLGDKGDRVVEKVSKGMASDMISRIVANRLVRQTKLLVEDMEKKASAKAMKLNQFKNLS